MFRLRYSCITSERNKSEWSTTYIWIDSLCFFRTILRYLEGDKNKIKRLPLLLRAESQVLKRVPWTQFNGSISDFDDMRSNIVFKIWQFIYFVIFIFIKRFPLKVCYKPEKHLYENKENLPMHAILKLGCSPNYDGLRVFLKKYLD